MAPEVLANKGYLYSVDWWSLGVLFYECVYGKPDRSNFDITYDLEELLLEQNPLEGRQRKRKTETKVKQSKEMDQIERKFRLFDYLQYERYQGYVDPVRKCVGQPPAWVRPLDADGVEIGPPQPPGPPMAENDPAPLSPRPVTKGRHSRTRSQPRLSYMDPAGGTGSAVDSGLRPLTPNVPYPSQPPIPTEYTNGHHVVQGGHSSPHQQHHQHHHHFYEPQPPAPSPGHVAPPAAIPSPFESPMGTESTPYVKVQPKTNLMTHFGLMFRSKHRKHGARATDGVQSSPGQRRPHMGDSTPANRSALPLFSMPGRPPQRR
ncbi:Serine/threonine kinase [Tieghemiomyces parasiticus]|uniref:Serine/threonine kinase n=1 Tax=Tieghemiomyces parasiticus TaxID=78921 RepID=A0A9W8A812_9FUNG|nr:Serine/threonine kinase [Tieghemiomyces parasiticus]